MATRPVGLSLVLSPDDLPVVPGREIAGRYRVLHRIGSGTLGLVVMALDSETDRRVVLKILMPRSTAKPNDPHGKRILRKAAIKAQEFTHSGAARILATHVESVGPNPSVILVLERQGAPSLETLLSARGRLPYTEACGIIDAVADVIEAAHEQGLLHLGLKPTNVFVDPRDNDEDPYTVVVTDLGLLEAARSCHQRGSPLPGSRECSAPEVLVYGDVDGRADVYGLGHLLWEMLNREDEVDDNDELLVPTDEHPAVPEELQAIVEKATSAEPDDRYPDVASFRAAIHEVMGVLTKEDEPARKRRGVAPWALWVGITAGALVVLAACVSAVLIVGVPAQLTAWLDDPATAWFGDAPAPTPQPVVRDAPEAGGWAAPSPDDVPTRVREPAPAPADAVLMPVSVMTDPPGATAWIDTESMGQTPVVLSVDPAEPVDVMLTLTGYRSRTVRLDGAAPRVRTRLEPLGEGTPEAASSPVSTQPPTPSPTTSPSATRPADPAVGGARPTGTVPSASRPSGDEPGGPDDLILER